jgi:hypothetical protein
MVAVATCFAQILSMIDRADFARAVRHHAAERAAKGFSCWDHRVALLFCQMGSAHSLREVCGGSRPSTSWCTSVCGHLAPTEPPRMGSGDRAGDAAPSHLPWGNCLECPPKDRAGRHQETPATC